LGITPGQKAADSPLKADASISTGIQIDFGSFLFVKVAASAYGEDLFTEGLTTRKFQTYFTWAGDHIPTSGTANDIEVNDAVTFALDEISATFNFRINTVHLYTSVFAGSFETPGTDVYIQKYLGVNHLSSMVMQNSLISNGLGIYPVEGVGASLTVRATPSVAVSLYGTVPANFKFTTKYANIDLRVAGAFSKVFFDVTAGVAILPAKAATAAVTGNALTGLQPAEAQSATKMGVGINFGASLVVGNLYGNSVFFQAGMNGLNPAAGTKAIVGSIFAVVEPRFVFDGFRLGITAFLLPALSADQKGEPYSNLRFIADDVNVGGAVSFYYDQLHIGNLNSLLGIVVAGGIETDLGTLATKVPKPLLYSVNIGVFWSLNLYNGTLNLMAKVDPAHQTTHPTTSKGTTGATATSPKSDVAGSIKGQISYLIKF
jgi:hypothetical protein